MPRLLYARGLILILTVGISLCGCIFPRNSYGQVKSFPEPKQTLDALETAINSLKSFDVQLQVKTDIFFSEQVHENGVSKPGLVVYERPKTDFTKSKQLFNNGWRRIEKYDSKSGKLAQVYGSDNETQRILFVESHRGSVARAGGKAIEWGYDYQETFRQLCDGIPISLIYRERLDKLTVRREATLIILEVPPCEGSYGHWGFRVYADTANKFFPVKIETYQIRKGVEEVLARMTVIERKTITPSLVVPIKAVTEFLSCSRDLGKYQQAFRTHTMIVDVEKSHWNEKISEDELRVQFPTGLLVIDDIREVALVVGKADPGKNLDTLVANSRIVAQDIRQKFPPPPKKWIWWVSAGLTVLILSIAGWFLMHYRNTSRTVS